MKTDVEQTRAERHAVVCGQVMVSLTMDHFGLFGLINQPLSPQILSACLLLRGAYLIG